MPQAAAQRQGVVLGAIMKFKQICNHPDQYLGQRQFIPEESGKFMQLQEIAETIYAKRERVLVITVLMDRYISDHH